MASYRLAYTAGAGFRARRWGTLIVLPALLAAACVVGYACFDRGLAVGPWRIDHLGSRTMAGLVHLMFFAVGWHYTKQTYGCARVGARFRGYPITAERARILRYALFPLWATPFVGSNVGHQSLEYYGLGFGSLGLPPVARTVTNVALVVGIVAIVSVFVAIGRETGRRPPAVVLAPIVALYVWWSPATFHPAYAYAVPMFHSLQYLPFVAKMERQAPQVGLRSGRGPGRRLAVIAAALAVAGWAVFAGIPHTLDRWMGTPAALGPAFFVLAVTVCVNIHHYFIDHVIWRLDDERLRTRLLA
jgi:hypothetical protein